MTDEEACAQLYRDLCDASMRKDADGIAEVLADDYALVHMTGMQQGKRAYIEAVCDGTKQSWQHSGGHFACIWKHEDGLFYMKDPSGPARQHNDVPYTHDQMDAWLVGAFENRYIIRAV